MGGRRLLGLGNLEWNALQLDLADFSKLEWMTYVKDAVHYAQVCFLHDEPPTQKWEAVWNVTTGRADASVTFEHHELCFWMVAGDLQCNSLVNRNTLCAADRVVAVWNVDGKVRVVFAGVEIKGIGSVDGYAVVHARAVTRSPMWYAALEWRLFDQLRDAAHWQAADTNLRLFRTVSAGFRCQIGLEED